METEAILALLAAAFPGVRRDGLQQLAAVIGIQCSNQEEATQAVGRLTADKVAKFVNDWRKAADAEIGRANATYEANLRRKYDFAEKHTQERQATATSQQTPATATGTALAATQEDKPVTASMIKQMIADQFKPLQAELARVNADREAATRRELFVTELDKAKVSGAARDMLLRDFERVKATFANAEDFQGYLSEKQGDFKALAQAAADKGLADTPKPMFGAVNEQGISQATADYIKSLAAPQPAFQGKEL